MYVRKTLYFPIDDDKKPLIYVRKTYIIDKRPIFGDGHRIIDNVPDGDGGHGGSPGGGASGGAEVENETGTLIENIRRIGIAGDSFHVPAKGCKIDELSVDTEHIKKRQHNVTESEAKSFVATADISITRWNGKFENYYSRSGASYVNTSNKTIATAFKASEYDTKTQKMMEEVKKWKKRE